MRTTRKFAWRPTVVWTWRSTPSQALIWLQEYFVQGMDRFSALGATSAVGEKYCTRLGLLSIEF